MTFKNLPAVGEEIQAGASTYRLVRVLRLVVDGGKVETGLYFQRSGEAEQG